MGLRSVFLGDQNNCEAHWGLLHRAQDATTWSSAGGNYLVSSGGGVGSAQIAQIECSSSSTASTHFLETAAVSISESLSYAVREKKES